MLRRMRCFVGLNPKNNGPGSPRRLVDAKSLPSSRRRAIQFRPPEMLDTVHEVAIYIHRFHNLDLFQQGWYQIKISMRWEDSSRTTRGTPSRVVQYEVPDPVLENRPGVWKIDDVDNSFSTQPFRIKYARQDILLSVMVSFNLAVGQCEGLLTSAVILKFELMHAPILENGFEMQASFDAVPPAIHEFRIPPKALLGLHSYCPVYFDAFHAVLVDLSIHIVLLRAVTHTSVQKVPSTSHMVEDGTDKQHEGSNELLGFGMGSKVIELVKALFTSREILLEELQKISSSIGERVDDLAKAHLNLGKFEAISLSLKPDLSAANSGTSAVKIGMENISTALSIFSEKSNGIADLGSDIILRSLPKEELLDLFYSVGSQLFFIWNAFLKFHRTNKTKVLEYLHQTWSMDRKAEWSIWMVHSKVEIPHRYLKSGAEDSAHHNRLGKIAVARKSSDDPAHSAATRAELHRRSIAQMKINHRSIQDLQIFGDPSHVPVILVEQHIVTVPLHGSGSNSSLNYLDQNDSGSGTLVSGDHALAKQFVLSQKHSRVLNVVVFVHGFQGHHLDLRLVRNQWLLIDPGAECLMSEVNEDKTSGDFQEMGSRLAKEVSAFVRKKIDKYSRYGCKDVKLSFVGHSIGNIIIRSALMDNMMKPFLKYLYTYMSISGPHLGYWYSSNSLFNSGLWLLKKLKGAPCIHQLTFTDDPDMQNTFFYKLCKQKTLEYFKNIILLSSSQDGYVPYHSARIELCHAAASDYSKKAQIFLEMLNNCLDQIRAPSSAQRIFMRCDVNFDTSLQGKNFNAFIGRAAHIEFLETDVFAKFLMWSYPELFL